MDHAIDPHELTRIDPDRYQVVQVSDGTNTVVLWEAPAHDLIAGNGPLKTSRRDEAATLTIRLCDPLNPVRRKDVCERLQARLNRTQPARRAAGVGVAGR